MKNEVNGKQESFEDKIDKIATRLEKLSWTKLPWATRLFLWVSFIVLIIGIVLPTGAQKELFDCITKSKLPVDVFIRHSLTNKDQIVIILENTSDNRIKFAATFESADAQKSFVVVLEAKGKKEIGWMEGWPVQYGHTLILQGNGYRQQTISITKENFSIDVVR